MLNAKNIGMEKFMSRMFRRADGVCWDLTTGKTGVYTPDGIATLNGEGESAFVDLNMFDQFSMEVPAFAQGTPIQDVALGDLIYFGSKETPGWVIGKEVKEVDGVSITTFKLMKTTGQTTSWRAPRVQMLGAGDTNVMVLRSLTNMLPGGNTDLGGIQNGIMQMVQMQMLMGGESDGFDLEKIMPMILMGQMGGNNNMMNTMLMMQMLGGNNPLGASKNPFKRG